MTIKIAFIVGKQVDYFPYKYTSRKAPKWLKEGAKEYKDFLTEDNEVPSDVAMAAYIIGKYKDSEVTLFDGNDVLNISAKELNEYDLVVIIYDPVEVFYCESKTGTCPNISKHLERITRRTKAFVLPPPDFHGYIIHKTRYYADLLKAGIPVVPFFHLKFKGSSKKIPELLKRINKRKWKGVIVKPSYAGYSMGIKVLKNIARTQKTTIERYLKKMEKMGYPDATVQEFVPSFGKNYEVRTYWINGKYSHSVATLTESVGKSNQGLSLEDITVPKSQGGTLSDSIITKLKPIGRKVLKALPIYKEFGTQPMIRIDFGCCIKGYSCLESYFVNEVETLAANLLADHTPTPVIQKVASAIYTFAKKVKRNKWSNTRSKKSRVSSKHMVGKSCKTK